MTKAFICDRCHSANAVAYDDRDYYVYCENCLNHVLVLGRIVHFSPCWPAELNTSIRRRPRPSQSDNSSVLHTFVEYVIGWLDAWEVNELRKLFRLPAPEGSRPRRTKEKV